MSRPHPWQTWLPSPEPITHPVRVHLQGTRLPGTNQQQRARAHQHRAPLRSGNNTRRLSSPDMSEPWPSPVTVALVGRHCCGKTTLGTHLAERLGFDWDEELGELAMPESGLCYASRDDWGILQGETARDSIARAGRHSRIVETWHPGNHAWACSRIPKNSAEMLEDLRERALEAVAEEVSERRVVALVITCSEEMRLQRRREGGAQRLTPGDHMEEEEFFAETGRIGDRAIAEAREMLGAAAVMEVSTDRGLEEAAVSAVRALLELLLPPPEVDEAPFFFLSLDSALKTLTAGAQLLPGLRVELERPKVADKLQRAYASYGSASGQNCPAFPVPVVTVDGLDGTGKSTVVRNLAARLGGVAMKTSPESLDGVRGVLEAEGDGTYSSTLRGSRAWSRVKRAFFMVSNYVAALEVADEAEKEAKPPRCVVIDRFYGSTAAYTLGCSPSSSPPSSLPGSVWAWPVDLPVPNAMLVLKACEEVRRARIKARFEKDGCGVGEWELRAAADPSFGAGVMEAFEALKSPPERRGPWHPIIDFVDAKGTEEDVLLAALACCRAKGIAPPNAA